MQAITVPWIPTNPNIPHVTYNGRTIHLKGIVRGGTPQYYKWSYGDPTDQTSPMNWTPISDPYNLGQTHAYSGMVNQLFIATLQVMDTNGVISTAIYPLEMYLSADTNITIARNCPSNGEYGPDYPCYSDEVITDPNQMNVRINVAEDEALWYLHVNQSRNTDNSGGDPNGVGTDTGWWADGEAGTCAAMEAFELHGSKPTADYDTDPYVEDTQRTLNYELANLTYYGSTGSFLGPGNGSPYGDSTYISGICAAAFAASGAPNLTAVTGRLNGWTYANIMQQLINWFEFSQTQDANGCGDYECGSWGYGGWHYYAAYGTADGSTTSGR
jgi:hypothetical protein